VTVDSAAQPESEVGDIAVPPAPTGTVARPFLLTAFGFLVPALVLGLVASLQLIAPDVVTGAGFVVYGRLLPVATNLFLYGWLTIGLAGALLHVVSRSGRVQVARPREAMAALGLMALGVVLGTIGVLAGFNQGRQYLEYPLWADAALLLGALVFARVLLTTARNATVDAGPVRWYAVAAAWWLPLGFLAGNIPGLAGVGSVTQTAFFRAAIVGLWLATGGLAVVYHVLARRTGRDTFPATRLTLLGFWSIAVVWALTAPAVLTYTAVPDWLETVGVIFSMGLIIPAAVVFTDLVIAMRRRWESVRGDVAVRFIMLGGALLGLWTVANLAMALRSSSGIVQYTDWLAGVEVIGIYGAFTAWLVAFAYHAAPQLTGGATSSWLGTTHYWLMVVAILGWAGGAYLSGLGAGWTWVASANEAAISPAGEGFRNTLRSVEGLAVTSFVGQAIYLVALLVFIFAVVRKSGGGTRPITPAVEVEERLDPELALADMRGPRRLQSTAVGLFVVAALLVWVIPWVETVNVEGTVLADSARRYADGTLEARGRAVYVAEGCWYCHTQQVRAIVADVGLGAASLDGDYVHETPALFGVQRIGPDLMHAGSREPTSDPAWLVSYLADPREERGYSTMPPYDHLSQRDLEALAAYIAASK
jgi:cytochrome c oxidase cbb3-type subunit I/II